ncbi:MAG: HipA family kinase [Planctomycetia bacterium]
MPDFWMPNEIQRMDAIFQSSTLVIRVATDLGDGYLKALGNPEGPQALACELVGSQLAQWFGLRTFEFGFVKVTEADDLRFQSPSKGRPSPGLAFISKAVAGEPWSGNASQLKRLDNQTDICRLVVLDTWIRNKDRYSIRSDGTIHCNRDNVFLSESAVEGKFLLTAMDYTHAFTWGRKIIPTNFKLDRIREEKVYGLFPEFKAYIDKDSVTNAARDMAEMTLATARGFVSKIPSEWEVSSEGREAMADFIAQRAKFLSSPDEEAQNRNPRIMNFIFSPGLFPVEDSEGGS